jgi:endogenous inhibitor of DNA gyrase (YacG/DUF329 family)
LTCTGGGATRGRVCGGGREADADAGAEGRVTPLSAWLYSLILAAGSSNECRSAECSFLRSSIWQAIAATGNEHQHKPSHEERIAYLSKVGCVRRFRQQANTQKLINRSCSGTAAKRLCMLRLVMLETKMVQVQAPTCAKSSLCIARRRLFCSLMCPSFSDTDAWLSSPASATMLATLFLLHNLPGSRMGDCIPKNESAQCSLFLSFFTESQQRMLDSIPARPILPYTCSSALPTS